MKTLAPIILAMIVLVGSAGDDTYNYIGNKNTKKFHETTCYTLPKEENRVYFEERDDAIEKEYTPCKNCNS